MTHHHCTKEVYWKQVLDYNLFAEQISSITFTKILYGTQIPDHCNEGIHYQQHVRIIFEPNIGHDEAASILDTLGLDWSNLTSEDEMTSRADGGEIFTRPNHKGDWVLKAPCMDCYYKLQLDKNQDLSKSYLLSFL